MTPSKSIVDGLPPAIPVERDELIVFIAKKLMAIARHVGVECQVGWSKHPVLMASKGAMHIAVEKRDDEPRFVVQVRHAGHKVFTATCVSPETGNCEAVKLRAGPWIRDLAAWAEQMRHVRLR